VAKTTRRAVDHGTWRGLEDRFGSGHVSETSSTYHLATRLPVNHEATSIISMGANTHILKLTTVSGTPDSRYFVGILNKLIKNSSKTSR
jgi:hypothetical protein